MKNRDENGWLVPRRHSKRRAIYEMMCEGKTPQEIIAATGGNPRTVRVHIWVIKNVDLNNARQMKYRPSKPRRSKPVSPYVDKLTRVLGISRYEARKIAGEV